jgi:hypothetical protein
MNPEAKKHYREVKNYVHNDLKITREDIRDILKAVVREEVRNYYGRHTIWEEAQCEMRRIINEENAGKMIKDELREIIKEELDKYEIVVSIKKPENK